MSGAGGSAATAGGQFGSDIDTLVITSKAREALESTSLQAAWTKVDRARLSMTLIVTMTRLSRSIGRLAGRGSGSGGSRVALEIVAIPVPSIGALRRRHLRGRMVGDTASLASVPVPARRRTLVTLGR